MKHNTNTRRGRSRGNGKRHIPLRSQTFESSGPDGKIRGTAQQVLDRYLALGRDAYSAGDPISAEAFYQHAEHYHRLLHAEGAEGDRGPARPRTADQPPGGQPPTSDGSDANDEAADGIDEDAPEEEEGVSRLPF
ncbi:MAG: DUF4167 domain-containing protein [Rhodospirillales bacterium]|nr:DUF4167 domain-containing protein [Rhodospirillales bacterium]